MTFTLLTADPRTGLLGAAAASRSLAVGNAVITVDPAVGVVASQAWTNRSLRARMLDALAEGASPSEVVGSVPQWDPEPERRQVAAMLPTGEADTRTGSETTAWAGAVIRPGLVVLGNLLAGAEVLQAVVETFERASHLEGVEDAAGQLARRMTAAMLAGEAAGGDRRGRQSAAVVVARVSERRAFPPALDVDLRVDDDEQPLHRLAALVDAQLRDRGDA